MSAAACLKLCCADENDLAMRDEPSEHESEEFPSEQHKAKHSAAPVTDAAVGEPTSAGSHSDAPSVEPKAAAKRKHKAPIDIDEHIAAARKAMKEAQKQVTTARTQARNEPCGAL